MRRKIAILAGGYSKEREISFSTAKEVFKVLKKKYNVILIDPKINFLSKLKKFKPDIVFNALHGRYGEDGYIQSILETAKIKYTHSGVKSSSIAIDKELSKKIFKKNKILTPTGFKFQYKEEPNYNLLIKKISKNLGYPVVLKPVNEGSSVGVFICNKSNVLRNLIKLRDFDEIIVEKYIPGREIQSAILGKKAIGSIELIPKRKFYDYKAKYNKRANTKHVMPAKLSIKKYREVNRIALKAHRLLNCRGVSRSDFRFYKNKFYLLELNTQPGMTSLSLVPEIARHVNIEFTQLIEELIKDASINK